MEETVEFQEEDLASLDIIEEDDDQDCGIVEEQKEMGEQVEVIELMKLKVLLKNVLSMEVQIYSEASKDLAKLFKRDSCGEFLRQYIRSSANCMELLEFWKMHRGKPGMVYVFSLISAVLDHPLGRSRASGIMRNLDSFSRGIVLERLEDVYVEMKSEQVKRQNAALRLLASIVRRGMGLASEVARTFDFKLSVLPKLSGNQKMKWKKHHETHSTRKSFVGFAISFLEVGNPRLLRWIIQQRVLYSGVLQGLANDDSETLIYVLSTLKDRVLSSSSLIQPSLRCVLFGIVTLEQLSLISGNPEGGSASDLAHEVLVMVCTDPCNGLMPNSNLKGNPARLFELMKKLKATEVNCHKDLLLAIVKGMPSLCALYMDAFPYNLEANMSPLWFSAISLTTELISSTNSSSTFNFLASGFSHDPPDFNGYEMQCILKSILPRPFTRSVCNKGLLHTDILVKHGSLRLLLEILKALDKLFIAIDLVAENNCSDQADGSECVPADWNGSSGFEFFGIFHTKSHSARQSDQSMMQKWMSFKQDLQDEVGTFLPDLQVLLNLLASAQRKIKSLSSLNMEGSCDSRPSLKRSAHLPEVSRKKLKPNTSSISDGIDIVISGVNLENNYDTLEENKDVKVEDVELEKTNVKMAVDEIWGTSKADIITNKTKDMDTFFYTKLLDTLALYIRTVPKALGGSFDFLKILPDDPSSLSFCHQNSILSLLVEYIGQSSGFKHPVRVPDMMYKHLLPLINLLSHTQGGSHDKAYALARSAMLSTGAFDQNVSEIDVWLLFLPGHCKKEKYASETKANTKLEAIVISFLCDAVSTMGNNLYKNLDHMRVLVSHLEGFRDESPTYSPLVPIIIEKCIRLLKSDSGTFKLSEKTMVSLYVCNTLSFLLQSQVHSGSLPYLISLLLSEKSNSPFSIDDDSNNSLCEWRPIKSLLLFANSILRQQSCDCLLHIPERIKKGNGGSLYTVLNSVKEVLVGEHKLGLDEVAVSLISSVTCATLDDILNCFPLLVIVVQQLLGAHTQILSSVLFQEWKFLSIVSNLWPDMFFSSLDTIEDTVSNNHESATTAFSFFLEHIPFYSIFTSAMNLSSCNVVVSTKMLKLLQTKLCSGNFGDSILSLRLVLFWTHKIRLFYKSNPSEALERLFQMCIVLIEHAIEQFFVIEHVAGILDSRGIYDQTEFIWELAELIILHPVVTQSLPNPLLCSSVVLNEKMFGNFEDFIVSSKKFFHPFDRCILRIFKRVVDSLIAPEDGQRSVCNIFSVPESLRKAIKNILHHCVDSFQENFDLCVELKDLVPFLPNFCILYGLMGLISPSDLLKLVHWMLSKIDRHLIGWKFPRMSALSVALCIANNTFNLFSDIPSLNKTHLLFWGSTDITHTMPFLKNVLFMILQFSTDFNLELADIYLLKAVDIVYNQRFSRPTANFLQFCMLMSRIFNSSPVEILRHCIYKPSKTKSALLFKLTETSPLHSRLFGMTLFDIIDKYPSSSSVGISRSLKGMNTMIDSSHAFTPEDFVLLLPSALSFQTCSLLIGCDQEMSLVIPTFYSGILLDIFSNWKKNVSTSLFYEDNSELISKPNDIQFTFHNTLLGKAVRMLQSFFFLSPDSIKRKQRLKYFDSMYSSDELFSGFDAMENKKLSCGDLFNFVNRVIGKISFTWLLLFPQENLCEDLTIIAKEDVRETSVRKESKRENCLKLKFMDCLAGVLDKIVRNTPFKHDSRKEPNSSVWFQLMRFLEVSILGSIVRLGTKNNNFLTQSTSIPFLEAFIKSSLFHRFDDPCTISGICNILNALKGRFNAVEVLELLLGHSKFVSVIHSGDSSPPSSGLVETGTFLQTLPSLFESIGSSFGYGTLESKSEYFDFRNGEHFSENIKLELVKLLRFLYPLAVSHNDYSAVSMNKKELISLLLSGYGASLSEADVETIQLILEIESIEKQNAVTISGMDYLWGTSALRLRKEEKLDKLVNDNGQIDCETALDKSRRIFRDNILIDSRICTTTVLNFNLTYMPDTCSSQKQSQHAHLAKMYDPSFMLRMSDNSLRKSFIDPLEFTRLGLLAYALISISSHDQHLRILGYEVLGSFQKVPMNQHKKNDVLQVQLLLTYLQNGITEPWQKIPSIIAIFAAEASFILLDSSHVHFQTISKLLTKSRKINLKEIPLFHTFFWNSSVNFRREHLWILQLIYAGLNLDDDAQILMSRFVIELLLSFYASSLSDTKSKVLILQILKKSVKLHKLACRLVMDCGLISWLYSDLLLHGERLFGDEKEFSIRQLEIVLEVILEVLSFRTITEWLKNEALEQLSEVSSYLHNLVVSSLGLLKGNISLVNSIFDVISSTLRISQKRKVYLPHFTISLDRLFQLYQVMDRELRHTRFSETCELGLRTLLMSTPPAVIFLTDKAKLAKVIFQAIPSALLSYCGKVHLEKELDHTYLKTSADSRNEESCPEKLLRWIIASVILGSEINVSFQRNKSENLQTLLVNTRMGKMEDCESKDANFDINRALAVLILHLYQLLAMKTSLLPSLVFALCLLFPNDNQNSDVKELLSGDLCSKIRCPAEVNTAWRWSFYGPWKDRSSEQTSLECVEEEQACQSLLLAFSNSFGGEQSASPILSHQDLEPLFSWERANIRRGSG